MDVGMVFIWICNTLPSSTPIKGGGVGDLAGGGGEHVDDALVGDGDDGGVVDLDDPVPHPDAAPLRNAPSQQGADLSAIQPLRAGTEEGGEGTYDAVLNGEAELVLGVRPLDADLDDGGRVDDGELDGGEVADGLDLGLGGGEGEAHEADAVAHRDLVPDIQLVASARRASNQLSLSSSIPAEKEAVGGTAGGEVGDDDGGDHGAPAGLHHHDPHRLALRLRDDHLKAPPRLSPGQIPRRKWDRTSFWFSFWANISSSSPKIS